MNEIVRGWAFTSFSFWPFLGAVLLGHWLAPKPFRNWILLVGSYLFYASWDWRFVGIILIPTIIDFSVAKGMAASDDPHRRRSLLLLSVVVDCGGLVLFKYNDFFVGRISGALKDWGIGLSWSTARVLIPIGISFFMLSSLSYVFDVYRRKMAPTRRFVDYALFMAFFPKLIAGPIERARTFLPQIAGDRRVDLDDVRAGAWFVLWGLFAKLVVADSLAPIVNGIFSGDPSRLTGLECWTGAYGYGLQLYGDFWGYSAIALGVSRWMGFHLTQNFRMPYFSKNPSEFWSRWHISLSTWLRDYIYLPLDYFFIRRLGSRRWLGLREEFWSYFGAVTVTMLIAGIWHGTGWTYVVWGLYFGLLLCLHRAYLGYRKLWGLRRMRHRRLSIAIRTLVMFNLACVGWVVFRADSIGQAGTMLTKMITNADLTSVVTYGFGLMALLAGPLLVLEAYLFRHDDGIGLQRLSWIVRGAAYTLMILTIIIYSSMEQHEFIYFRF